MSETLQEDPLLLIVDDDPDMRSLLQAAFAGAGFRPVAVDGGMAALALLDQMRPDLILLDAVMPDPDGFETCRRIKQRVDMSATPIVFMTGLTETHHVVAGLKAGGVDYVTKPLMLDELIARVRVHIATGEMTRSAQRALDTAGRRLIASDEQGRVLWSTPRAGSLLQDMGFGGEEKGELARTLRQMIVGDQTRATLNTAQARCLEVVSIAPVASDYFFRLFERVDGMEEAILRDNLGLTPRESEVLRWIAAGKSNKDIGEIMNISSRTVNKHLEPVYVKLGVENRAAAAAIATRLIASVH